MFLWATAVDYSLRLSFPSSSSLNLPPYLYLKVGAVVLRNELESAAYGVLSEVYCVAELGIQCEVGCAFAFMQTTVCVPGESV